MNIQQLEYLIEIERTRSISQAAANLYMGQPNLSRILRELYGTTTNRLIWMRRMETACDLLRSSPLNIGEIAARCGYANIYTFSHAFRRAFGVPPTDWRG